jgi:hypothetical protein
LDLKSCCTWTYLLLNINCHLGMIARNHALSTAPRSPLLTLFDARPIGIEGRSGLRVKTRSAGETLLVKALRVTLTVPGQYYESGRLGQGLENSRSHSNKKQRWVRSLKLQMPSGRCWSPAVCSPGPPRRHLPRQPCCTTCR